MCAHRVWSGAFLLHFVCTLCSDIGNCICILVVDPNAASICVQIIGKLEIDVLSLAMDWHEQPCKCFPNIEQIIRHMHFAHRWLSSLFYLYICWLHAHKRIARAECQAHSIHVNVVNVFAAPALRVDLAIFRLQIHFLNPMQMHINLIWSEQPNRSATPFMYATQ